MSLQAPRGIWHYDPKCAKPLKRKKGRGPEHTDLHPDEGVEACDEVQARLLSPEDEVPAGDAGRSGGGGTEGRGQGGQGGKQGPVSVWIQGSGLSEMLTARCSS